MVRVQQGDERAFETLAIADYPRLHRLAFNVLGDSASAEDATQQAYLDIWRNLRRLRDPAKYRGVVLSPPRTGVLRRGQAAAEVDYE